VSAVNATAHLLADLGHHVEDDHPGALHDGGFSRHAAIIVPFAFAAFAFAWWERRLGSALGEDDVEPWTWFCVQRGRQIDAGQYLSAVEWIQAWTRRVVTWWADGFDILVTPTVAFPPPALPTVPTPGDLRLTGGRAAEIIAFTYPFNMTGQPAISLPLHQLHGVPLGIQLVAAPGREDVLFSVAHQLEHAQPVPQRRPPIAVSA
jgi:amidase